MDDLKEEAVQHIEQAKDIMNLTNDELLEMNKFLFKHRSTNRDLLRLIVDSNMNPKQKMFLCYVRGTAQEFNNAKIRHDKEDKSTYINEVDAYESIASGFNGWEIIEIIRVLLSSLKTVMIESLDENSISEMSMKISDSFCKFSDDYKNIKDLEDKLDKKN